MATEAHLGQLEAVIIEIVDARIKHALGQLDAKPVYGSRKPYPPIPGKSHRWTREHAAAMGGERRGGRRGRDVVWLVTHEQYSTWLASKRATTAGETLRRSEPDASNVVDIDAIIKAAGYRATRVVR